MMTAPLIAQVSDHSEQNRQHNKQKLKKINYQFKQNIYINITYVAAVDFIKTQVQAN